MRLSTRHLGVLCTALVGSVFAGTAAAQVLFEDADGSKLFPRFGLSTTLVQDPVGEPAVVAGGDPNKNFADLTNPGFLMDVDPEWFGEQVTFTADVYLPADSGLESARGFMRFFHDADGNGTVTYPSDEFPNCIMTPVAHLDFGLTDQYQTVEVKARMPQADKSGGAIDGMQFNLVFTQADSENTRGQVKVYVKNVMLYVGELPEPEPVIPPEPAEPE